MESVPLFIRGVLIGLAIAAPVGPIGVLCIRRTLAHGRIAGLVSGLGAATADALYGSIAGFGLVMLSKYLIDQAVWLRWIGGIFLVYLGVKTFLTHPAREPAVSRGRGLLGIYASTVFLTVTNPMTILSFTAIFASLGTIGSADFFSAWQVVGGIFTGSAIWWLFLSGLVSVVREKLNMGGMVWVNRTSGVIIVVFGAVALLQPGQVTRDAPAALLTSGEAQAAYASNQGFSRADGTKLLVFPRDHGPHPDYQTEWWYYTGNLRASDGRRFGYQLTFFRRALLPPAELPGRTSDWGTDQVYMVHFALTDASESRHLAVERLERGAAGLSGAQPSPFAVWVDNFRVEGTSPDAYHLQAMAMEDNTEFSLDLDLIDVQGPTLQGIDGYSQKGPEKGNASYYYSLARLETSGNLKIGDREYFVKGSSWMDHEFSTGALAADQVGWDWFSIQLDNGSELMFFQLRKLDGAIDPFSSGILIQPDGRTVRLSRQDFDIQVLRNWQSSETGAVYPAGWRVTLPAQEISLNITPVLANQELDLSYTYWEGAVDIKAEFGGQTVEGVGYVELTGYAGSMSGKF